MIIHARDLIAGAYFETLLTKRAGRAMEDGSDEGTLVEFYDGKDEEKVLHPEVRVRLCFQVDLTGRVA